MGITAADVKALREKTGAGMMDCKKALTEVGGDQVKEGIPTKASFGFRRKESGSNCCRRCSSC